MGEKQCLAEGRLAVTDFGRRGDARERRQALKQLRIERQRHEARPGFDERQSELLGDAIGKAGGAHLGDRLAAGGDDERGRLENAF